MTRTAPPDPGNTAFTARRDVRIGTWLLAVPAHLTMVGGVLATVALVVVPSDVLAGWSSPPSAPTTAAVPSSSPSPSTAGGWMEPTLSSAALDVLDGLTVSASEPMSGYDRSAVFGGWIDADADCVDTRDEVLDRDLADAASDDGCQVASGTLDDPYTGASIRFTRGAATSSDVQIDHVVPAGNAWASGARSLSRAERVEFYNDPLNLLAVGGSVNGAKSDSPADEWLPPEESFHCEYVATQIAVKAKYGLRVTAAEKETMADVLSTCPHQELPADDRNEDPQ